MRGENMENNNDKNESIRLCEKEVNTIINGMKMILRMNEDDELSLSENGVYWYSRVKNLFESFKQSNF